MNLPLCVLHQELVQDVLANAWSRSGCHRHHGNTRKQFSQNLEVSVVGSEVVAPLLTKKEEEKKAKVNDRLKQRNARKVIFYWVLLAFGHKHGMPQATSFVALFSVCARILVLVRLSLGCSQQT